MFSFLDSFCCHHPVIVVQQIFRYSNKILWTTSMIKKLYAPINTIISHEKYNTFRNWYILNRLLFNRLFLFTTERFIKRSPHRTVDSRLLLILKKQIISQTFTIILTKRKHFLLKKYFIF